MLWSSEQLKKKKSQMCSMATLIETNEHLLHHILSDHLLQKLEFQATNQGVDMSVTYRCLFFLFVSVNDSSWIWLTIVSF